MGFMRGILLIAVMTGFYPLSLGAQPTLPSPGAVEESLRAPSQIEIQPEIDIQTPDASAGPAVPAGGVRIPIRQFSFVGNTAYTDDELRQQVSDYEGKLLTLEEIYAVSDILTNFYLENGYSVALVTVPAQQVSDGLVRFEVIEGTVSRLIYEGSELYTQAQINPYLYRVEPGEILRFDNLERSVLLLNDLPGLLVRSVILPGDEYGTSDLMFSAESSAWDGRVSLDNHGPETIGQWRLSGDLSFNNSLGVDDRLDLGITVSEENLLRQGRVAWSRRMGYDGGRLSLNISRADYEVGGDFSSLGITGHSNSARIQYTHPQLRTRRENLYWSIAATHHEGRSVMEGVDASISDSTVNLLELGLNHDKQHEEGKHSFMLRLSSNMSRNKVKEDGVTRDSGVPMRALASVSGEQFVTSRWSLYARTEIQHTLSPLPDSAQYAIGGPYSVRGFESSRHRGDQGISGSAELRHYNQFYGVFSVVRGFLDAGRVTRLEPLDSQARYGNLASVGLGLSTVIKQYSNLDLLWATPIHGREEQDDRHRVWISLGYGF